MNESSFCFVDIFKGFSSDSYVQLQLRTGGWKGVISTRDKQFIPKVK